MFVKPTLGQAAQGGEVVNQVTGNGPLADHDAQGGETVDRVDGEGLRYVHCHQEAVEHSLNGDVGQLKGLELYPYSLADMACFCL